MSADLDELGRTQVLVVCGGVKSILDVPKTLEALETRGVAVAALGTRFYTGDQFPAGYKNQLFIAEHGSWNRSVPIGYRVTLATMEGNDRVKGYHVFAKGWLDPDGSSWGRPVDVLVMPDGSLLVSDDRANAIYRISYEG